MSANRFGERFQITTFGESHGPAMGVVIDGCPAGVVWNQNLLNLFLQRRRPGQTNQIVTARNEVEQCEILSGVYENKTLGTPIAMIVRNHDQRSKDYQDIKAQPRIGHADDVWKSKFNHVDHRGGGRTSGRETVSRVMAGSVAQMLLNSIFPDLKVVGYSFQIGQNRLSDVDLETLYMNLSIDYVDQFQARFPSVMLQDQVTEQLKQAQHNGDSLGGQVQLVLKGVPPSLGQPVFHKLKSDLAMAMMGIGAVTGVEFGAGFLGVEQNGITFHSAQKNYGGIRGGISTGEEIFLNVAIKPTSSILDIAKQGRHDPCILTRAIPVIEAMAWLVLADHVIWTKSDQINHLTVR